MRVDLSSGGSVEGDKIRVISLADWIVEGEKRFGSDKKLWKFRCSHCGHIQSFGDFIELNRLGISPVNPETAYMSCIGRFDSRLKIVGTLNDKVSPCNYTLGGLFCFADTFVEGTDGKKHPVFEWAENNV
jgi:hypothetical protein